MIDPPKTSSIYVGQIFVIFNRRSGRRWQGSFDQVCNALATEGFDVAAAWADQDSEVRMKRATASAIAVVGRTQSARIGSLLPMLRSRPSPSSAETAKLLDEAIATFEPDELKALARLLFVFGGLAAVEKRRLTAYFDPATEDYLGMTAVGWACAFGLPTCVQLAISNGWPIEHRNRLSWNYVDLAARNGHAQIAADLVRAGVAPLGETILNAMRSRKIPLSRDGSVPTVIPEGPVS